MAKKKSNKTIYQLYKVNWTDAAVWNGWRDLQRLDDLNGAEVTTIGFLVRQTKDIVCLSPTLTRDGSTSSTWQIPRKWISKMTKIKGYTVEYIS